MTHRIERSACPYDCPDTCGLLVNVVNDVAVGTAGDPSHPYSLGRLCAKMTRYHQTVHSTRRLTTPLIRNGQKGDAAFRPASWDEALDLICRRWREIIERYGAEAILPYSYAGTMGIIQRNAGHPFFHKLGASRLARTICSPAKDAGRYAVMGDTPSPHPDTVLESDFIILWGINAAATSVNFLHRVAEARRKGATVWMIDTYHTPTEAAVDRTIIVRPGSDAALALGIMHILERDNRIDLEFIDQHVQGYIELKAGVLPDYSPAKASELTGIPEKDIEELAALYSAAKAPFIRLGSGLSRYGNGAMTVRTIVALPALVGAYGKKGGGCFCGTSTSGAVNMPDFIREDFLPKPTRIVNMNRLGEALNELSDPPVMSLYVYHSNPAAITPDQNSVIKGLEREDIFTVVHERFMTDTARYADVVIPATTSLEHSDIYRSYGNYCIQRAYPIIRPVGESKSNWEVFSLLAKGMDFGEPFFRMTANQMIDHLLALPSPWREGINLEELAQGIAVELNVPFDSEHPYNTPSGKIEILNPLLKEHLPRYIPPYEDKEKGHPLRLMTAPNLYSLNASFYEREELRDLQGGMYLLMNRMDASARKLSDGEKVAVWNDLGNATFILKATDRTPVGVVVAEGVWWLEFAPGKRSVNALTSQRLTDMGEGSTFYDTRVEVGKSCKYK